MYWLAVNKDGTERVFVERPHRDEWLVKKRQISFDQWRRLTPENSSFWSVDCCDGRATLKPGSIEKILGYKLTWYDSSVEVNITNIGDYVK